MPDIFDEIKNRRGKESTTMLPNVDNLMSTNTVIADPADVDVKYIPPGKSPLYEMRLAEWKKEKKQIKSSTGIRRAARTYYNGLIAKIGHEISKPDITSSRIKAIEIYENDVKKLIANGGRRPEPIWETNEIDFIEEQLRLSPDQRDDDYGLQNISEQYERTTAVIESEPNPLEAKVLPPTTAGQKASDIATGIGAFVTQLALLKKVAPAAPQEVIWEAQSLLSGNKPGEGAATYAAFALPGKIIGGTSKLAKAGRLAGESSTLAGITALESKIETGEIDATEVLIAAGIPIALKIPGFAKETIKEAIRRNDKKVIEAIRQVGCRPRKGKTLGATKWGVPIIAESTPTKAISVLEKHYKSAKTIGKTEVKEARHKLRQIQSSETNILYDEAIRGGMKPQDARKFAKSGMKRKMKIVEIEPPNLSAQQSQDLYNRINELYPPGSKGHAFTRENTFGALDKLLSGRIPTNAEFVLLDPVLGREATTKIANNLIAQKSYQGWDYLKLSLQAAKTPFAFDPQAFRQLSSSAARHPLNYLKSGYVNIRAYLSGKYADKIDKQVEDSIGFKTSSKYVDYIPTTPYGIGKLEQFGFDFSDFLLSRKNKFLRGYGKILKASERGATTGINVGLKGLWDSSEKELAALKTQRLERGKPMTNTEVNKWRTNRGKVISHFNKRLIPKSKTAKDFQKALNYVMFSPSYTFSRPTQYIDLFAKAGSRQYAAELIATNIGKKIAIGYLLGSIGNRYRLSNPTEEPPIDGTPNIFDGRFGKGIFGNESLEYGGGDSSFETAMARLIGSAYLYANKKITKKEQTTISGKRIDQPGKILINYLNSRETALIGVTRSLATGKDYFGNDISRISALAKAVGPEPITAIVESALADGMGEAITEGRNWDAIKAGYQNLAFGGAGLLGLGVTTIPPYTSTTRKKFRNIISNEKYGKDWDDLQRNEQKNLEYEYYDEVKTFETKIKIEQGKNPYDPTMSDEMALKAGKNLRKSLSQDVKKFVGDYPFAVDRKQQGLYLNDERYQKFRTLTAKYLDEYLKNMIDAYDTSDWDLSVRTQQIGIQYKNARKRAFNEMNLR